MDIETVLNNALLRAQRLRFPSEDHARRWRKRAHYVRMKEQNKIKPEKHPWDSLYFRIIESDIVVENIAPLLVEEV